MQDKTNWTAEKDRKFNLHDWRNWLVQIEELVVKITLMISDLQSVKQGMRTPREKLENSRKLISR